MSAEAIQYPFTQDKFVDDKNLLTQNNIAWINNTVATLNNFLRVERESGVGASTQTNVYLLTVTSGPETQRDLLANPGFALFYNTTASKLQFYDGTTWVDLY